MSAIKNIGTAAISSILSARDVGGFRSLGEFAQRVDLQKVNKKALESLIRAGAMDDFGKRSAMLATLENLIAQSHKSAKQLTSGQTDLFVNEPLQNSFDLPDMEEMAKEQLLADENEFLGFYLTEHPLQKSLNKLGDMVTVEIAELNSEIPVGKSVTIGGIIVAVRKVMTKKNNEEMAFITISGITGTKIDAVVFPKLYKEKGGSSFWQTNCVVVASGKVDNRDDKLSLVLERVRKID